MKSIKKFIQNNQFLVLVLGMIFIIIVMVILTITVTRQSPGEITDDPSEPGDGPDGVVDFEYDNSQLIRDEEPETGDGIGSEVGHKNFGALEFELPVDTDHFVISKIGEERYLVELNADFPQAEQAASIYLRQFNLSFADPEIVVEYI